MRFVVDMGELISKRFDEPDEIVNAPNLTGQIVVLGDVYIGRYVHQPSFKWSTDIKPIVGTESCQVHHLGVVISGQMQFVNDDGGQRTFGPGEAFDAPPGHEGFVVGDEPFVTIEFRGVREWAKPKMTGERVLATMLFTDIVGSTDTASRLGDAAWKRLLTRHYDSVRSVLDRFRGFESTTTGDGFLALFDGTARAALCAMEIREVARNDGIEVRIGIHAGEVERHLAGVQGLAVHMAARVMAHAGPGEVMMSAPTVALLEGSGLNVVDAGEYELKGFEGRRRLFRLINEKSQSGAV